MTSPKWFLSINNFIFTLFDFCKWNGTQFTLFASFLRWSWYSNDAFWTVAWYFRRISTTFISFCFVVVDLMIYWRYSFIFGSRIHPLHSIQIKWQIHLSSVIIIISLFSGSGNKVYYYCLAIINNEQWHEQDLHLAQMNAVNCIFIIRKCFKT